MAQKLKCAPTSESGATAEASLDAAYSEVTDGVFLASALTRGPWHPDHQHAGPPSALICRAIERAAANDGLTHLARLTVNLLRPAPIGECRRRGRGRLCRPQHGPLFWSLDRTGKGHCAFHGAHAARGGFAHSRGDCPPSAAESAEAARRVPDRQDSYCRQRIGLRRPRGEPGRRRRNSSRGPAPRGSA